MDHGYYLYEIKSEYSFSLLYTIAASFETGAHCPSEVVRLCLVAGVECLIGPVIGFIHLLGILLPGYV
jgi:hypothetical protein